MIPPNTKKIGFKKKNVQLEPNTSELVIAEVNAPNAIKDPVPSIKVGEETVVDNGRIINNKLSYKSGPEKYSNFMQNYHMICIENDLNLIKFLWP